MRRLVRQLWRENAGGSLVEYAFLAGLILVAVAAIVAAFSGATRSSLSRASTSVAASANGKPGAASGSNRSGAGSGAGLTVTPGIGLSDQVGHGYSFHNHFKF